MEIKRFVNIRMYAVIAVCAFTLLSSLGSCTGDNPQDTAGGTDNSASTGNAGAEEGGGESGESEPNLEAEAHPGDTDTMIIGLSAPLSGSLASVGAAYVNGAAMACGEVNARGGMVLDGKPYTLLVSAKDDEGKDASDAINALIAENASVIVGPATSDALGSVEKLCNNEEVLLVSPSASFGTIEDKGDFIFKLGASGSDLADGCVKVMANQGCETAAVVYTDSLYSTALRREFRAACSRQGMTILAEVQCAEDASDYRGALDALSSTDADFVFLPLYAKTAAGVLEELTRMGYQGKCIGGDGLEGVSELLESPLPGEVTYLSRFHSSSEKEPVSRFVESYTEKYGAPMSASALAYDAVMAVVEAVEASESDDPDEIRAALSDPAFRYNGVTGEIRLTEEGELQQSSLELMRVERGEAGFSENWVESIDL